MHLWDVQEMQVQKLQEETVSNFKQTMSDEQLVMWYNPECSKCNYALEFLQSNHIAPGRLIEYLSDVPAEMQIREVLQKLGIPAEQLVRKKEPVFAALYEGKNLSEEEWIAAMHQHPELIQRPILIKGDRAFIGRTDEELKRLL